MSRGVFSSHNKVGETMSFQTNSSSATTFDPLVIFLSGNDRVSWDVGGSGYIAGNSLSYTYPDTGITKTVTLRTNKLNKLKTLQSVTDNLVGQLDLSGWVNLGGAFTIHSNPNLTGVTHSNSTQVFTSYNVRTCNLIGNHDISMFPNLGGGFYANSNTNLTGVTHTASTQVFSAYWINSCNITGNYDVSMFSNLGGQFYTYSNPLLTSITHTASTQVFTNYRGYSCNLSGTHDVSMLTGLGGTFYLYNNPLLRYITHTASTEIFTSYNVSSCSLSGTHDVSMLTGLGGVLHTYSNINLLGVTFPISEETFQNSSVDVFNSAFAMYGCDLNYVDFTPLSGITMDVNSASGASIYLNNNTMSTSDVNHILSDFRDLTGSFTSKWSGVTLDIGGTNSAPDTTSGGHDGLGAINYLTGATAGWTIITS